MAAKVPTGLYWKTRLVGSTRAIWRALGNFESRILAEELAELSVQKPVYVTALARSGTTIVTEFLNEHPALTSLRYSDFPWLYTPYWRNWLRQRSQAFEPTAVQRAHQDRIMVTQDSPEAYEEPIWMDFFPAIHDCANSQILNEAQSNPQFELFYRNQIKKLLLVREAPRYLAKGNYNVSRIGYLLKLFPDARFIVMVRNPLNHVASLLKQHRAFLHAQDHDPRTSAQLSASGHFEFGPNRLGINLGQTAQSEAIADAWDNQREVEGWARHWSMIYQYLHDLVRNEPYKSAVMLIRYEDLCTDSPTVLPDILEHCNLDPAGFEETVDSYVNQLAPPDYYKPDFKPSELEVLRTFAGPTASLFGYEV